MSTAKQPRKVALINVADYPREKYNAYWEIVVDGDDSGYHWYAKIIGYQPVAWDYQGNRTETRPDAPFPQYPEAPRVKQGDYLRMSADAQAAVRELQDKYRARCSEIYEVHPKPVHLIAERVGPAETRDEADTAAQSWVIEQMKARSVS